MMMRTKTSHLIDNLQLKLYNMKTTLKLALSLVLVTLMVSQAAAQDARLSLEAQYEPIKFTSSDNSQITTDLLKDEFQEIYNRESDQTDNYRFRNRYRRPVSRWEIDKFYPRRGTMNFVNVYLGLNNYLEDGDLPNSNSLLSLNPITSFYGAISLDNITNILGPLYLDWGAGLSVQDFSFENTRARVTLGDEAVSITEAAGVSGRKSRLTMSHINVHFVPTLSFGRYDNFRVGFGVYAGYRIGSHTKIKYDDAEGETQRERVRDNYFINPFKYGFRATVGWRSFDLFFNYDITELFEEDIDAPRLNPVTFGVIL